MQFFNFAIAVSILATLAGAAPLPQEEVPTGTFSGMPSGVAPTGCFPSGAARSGATPSGGFDGAMPYGGFGACHSGVAPSGDAPMPTGTAVVSAAEMPAPTAMPSGAIHSGVFPSGCADPVPTGGGGFGGHMSGLPSGAMPSGAMPSGEPMPSGI